jgi:hypothetical protein
MEDIHAAFNAVADSLLSSKKGEDDSKYGPVARQEHEFQDLIEQQEFENYFISRLPADRYATIKEIDGVRTLLVDIETIPEHVLLQHSDKFKEAYEQMGGAAVGNRSGIAPSLESVDEVYELNEGRLPRQLLPVFEEALVLRSVERRRNISRGTVYDWRGEVASSYSSSGHDPLVAQNLISLCSTGYFDEEDIFDKMYTELCLDGSSSIQDFKSTLTRYIKENPFAVFVKADGMSGRDIFHLSRGKIQDIDKYPASPGFVEICGKGQETHPIIDDARDFLSDKRDYDMSTRRNRTIDQKILRIIPKSS